MAKKGINAKAKGNRVELQLAKILTERFDTDFKRAPMSGGWGTSNRNTTLNEAKEILSGDLIVPKNFKFSIESKSRADFNFWDMLNEDTINLEINNWILQANNDAECVGKKPLIFIKINNKKPFVLFPQEMDEECLVTYKGYCIMRFDYFLKKEDSFFFEE
jgi:hypothetical protein